MADQPITTIRPAQFPQDANVVSTLFVAYAASLGIDLAFQNFTEELSSLPGKYSPQNGGALFLAIDAHSDKPIGCVALRRMKEAHCCEIKRLYVSPDSRGSGAGRLLLKAVLDTAKGFGYREIRLDTLPSMGAARALYKRYGFREIEAYYDTPLEGTVFLALDLANHS